MRFLFTFLGAVSLLASLACTPIQRGATKDSFIVGGQPNMAITITPQMPLYATAKKSIALATDKPHTASARMTYAIFAATEDDTVTHHAHTLIVSPSAQHWIFSPETYKSYYAISTSKERINGRFFTVQTLLVPSKQDWFSQLWQENAYRIPQGWLAMRWSFTPNDKERVVAEYREPLPPCIQSSMARDNLQSADTLLPLEGQQIWSRCEQELRDFTTRAYEAIAFGSLQERGIMQEGTRMPNDSSHRPDFTRHVGELEAQPRDSHRYRD